MPDDNTPQPKVGRKLEEKKKLDMLRKQKEKKEKEEIIKQLATRAKLERDYYEDTVYVTFYTSPETKRTVLARRPSHSEMLTIMQLSVEASKYEGRLDIDAQEKMIGIYEKLPKLAAKLTVDETLDEKFWTEIVSFSTLQNFIGELILETQKGTGPGSLKPEELQSFRRE